MSETQEALVDARLAILRARYPAAFPPESDTIARQAIRDAVSFEAVNRRTPLENGDAPAGVFSPVRLDRSRGEA